MPRLKKERSGSELKISNQTVRYSRWPVKKRGPSVTLQYEILTSDPWEVIRSAIQTSSPNAVRPAALSFLRQSMEFYLAAQNFQFSSKPLLLYYCLLNLAKAFILHRGKSADLSNARHGIAELRLAAGAREFFDAEIQLAKNAPGGPSQIFDLFGQALGLRPMANNETHSIVKDILPQIVIGHRLWASAANQDERFIRIQRIRLRHSQNSKSVWLSIDFSRSDLTACKLSHAKFCTLTKLGGAFREVKARPPFNAKKLCRFEMKNPVPYTRRPGDVLPIVCKSISQSIWTVVRSVPPYRRYYVNAAPMGSKVLMQSLSIYAAIFYLGSVTRYRPHHLDAMLNSEYGNLIHEIVENQIRQVLFDLASEFADREVSSPAIL